MLVRRWCSGVGLAQRHDMRAWPVYTVPVRQLSGIVGNIQIRNASGTDFGDCGDCDHSPIDAGAGFAVTCLAVDPSTDAGVTLTCEQPGVSVGWSGGNSRSDFCPRSLLCLRNAVLRKLNRHRRLPPSRHLPIATPRQAYFDEESSGAAGSSGGASSMDFDGPLGPLADIDMQIVVEVES